MDAHVFMQELLWKYRGNGKKLVSFLEAKSRRHMHELVRVLELAAHRAADEDF